MEKFPENNSLRKKSQLSLRRQNFRFSAQFFLKTFRFLHVSSHLKILKNHFWDEGTSMNNYRHFSSWNSKILRLTIFDPLTFHWVNCWLFRGLCWIPLLLKMVLRCSKNDVVFLYTCLKLKVYKVAGEFLVFLARRAILDRDSS